MYDLYYNRIVKTIANNEKITDLINEALLNITYDLQNKLSLDTVTFHHSLLNQIHFKQYNKKVILYICRHKYVLSKNNIIKYYRKIVSNKTCKNTSMDIMTRSILRELIRQTNIFI